MSGMSCSTTLRRQAGVREHGQAIKATALAPPRAALSPALFPEARHKSSCCNKPEIYLLHYHPFTTVLFLDLRCNLGNGLSRLSRETASVRTNGQARSSQHSSAQWVRVGFNDQLQTFAHTLGSVGHDRRIGAGPSSPQLPVACSPCASVALSPRAFASTALSPRFRVRRAFV